MVIRASWQIHRLLRFAGPKCLLNHWYTLLVPVLRARTIINEFTPSRTCTHPRSSRIDDALSLVIIKSLLTFSRALQITRGVSSSPINRFINPQETSVICHPPPRVVSFSSPPQYVRLDYSVVFRISVRRWRQLSPSSSLSSDSEGYIWK